jgi:hypothetical protein
MIKVNTARFSADRSERQPGASEASQAIGPLQNLAGLKSMTR